jgi:uncharacterized protein YigE (DUF2233 family)
MSTQTNAWHNIGLGIEYQRTALKSLLPWSKLHAFRIDLMDNTLEIDFAKNHQRPLASAEEFVHWTGAAIAINGGFFDRNNQPLGLRISNYVTQNPFKSISWWGVFSIKNGHPNITAAKHYHPSPDIQFAIESGPRLLIQGKSPNLKPNRAERSALCITRDKKILILATENAPMTTFELAELIKKPPFDCVDALNLDGGSSTQLKSTLLKRPLSLKSFASVSDAVIVKPK